MRACAYCNLPVRKQDEEPALFAAKNRVAHKDPPGCPQPIQPQPQHTGKKHAGFQAQLRVADLCKTGREQLVHIKHCIEHGQLGHKDTREYAVLLKLVAEDIISECDAASGRRKELNRGKQD